MTTNTLETSNEEVAKKKFTPEEAKAKFYTGTINLLNNAGARDFMRDPYSNPTSQNYTMISNLADRVLANTEIPPQTTLNQTDLIIDCQKKLGITTNTK